MKKTFILCLLLSLGIMTGGAEGKRVLFIGDSITDGNWGRVSSRKPSNERNHKDMNHIYGHSFMFICAAHMQSEYPEKDLVFFNRGMSGFTIYDMEQHWQEDALELKPDVLSILIGVNDAQKYVDDFDYAKWEQTYRSLLDKTLAQNPNLKIVLGAPFLAHIGRMKEKTNYAERKATVERCAEIVEKIANDYNAIFVPYDKMFADLLSAGTAPNETYWIWDGIHPTPAGHKRMADLWLEATKDLF